MKRNLSTCALLFIIFLLLTSFNNSLLDERDVNLKITFKINVTGHLKKMVLKMIIPDDLKDRQSIKNMSFSIEPDSIYKIGENKYALFRFYDVEKSFKVVVKTRMMLFRDITNKTDTITDFSKFLMPEKDIESDSPGIIALAATLKKKTDIETVMETFEYVKQHISYKLNDAVGAEKVLETHVGKCMDFSDLFVALLRANNIPAKSNFGIVVDYTGDNPLHAWPEVYLKKQGWIRFDPTTGHSDISKAGKDFIMHISNKYITLSEGRNDPELHLSQYHYFYTCTPGSEAKLKLNYDVVGE